MFFNHGIDIFGNYLVNYLCRVMYPFGISLFINIKNNELLKRKFPLRHNVLLGCEMENYIDTIGMYNKTLVVAVIVLFSISIYLQLRIQIYCFKCTYYSSKTCNQSNSVLKRRLNFFGKITYIKKTNTQRDERMINAALKSMS